MHRRSGNCCSRPACKVCAVGNARLVAEFSTGWRAGDQRGRGYQGGGTARKYHGLDYKTLTT